MSEIKFGTDGWRGIISEDFTFDNVRRVARAIADYYNPTPNTQHPTPKIAVGYDTRFLSDRYAQLVSEVLIENGIDVVLSDRPIPTPALSFAVKNKKLTAGIMITASHNPAIYNGIKIKTESGGAAGIEVTSQIEKRVESQVLGLPSTTLRPGRSGVLSSIIKQDLAKDYIRFLRSYIDLKRLKNAKFKVLVDAMYGSGNSFIAQILKDTKINLEFMRADVNPSFEGLRPEPVLENLKATQKKLKKEEYDLCIVLDGDADRIAAFAGKGEFLHPQKILGLLVLHLVQERRLAGGVVKTIAGTSLIDKIAQHFGLRLYETPVGFKYISELMEKEDILVGGEEAGGIGFKGYIPERDGTLAGLLLLEMMSYENKPMLKILNEMEKQFGRYYYLREDIHLSEFKEEARNRVSSQIEKFKSKKDLLGKNVIQVKDFDGVKLVCEDESWLMLRPSGTEPLVRIYAEAKSLTRAKKIINFGIDFIKNAL